MEFYKLAGALILAGSGVATAHWLNRKAARSLFQAERWLTLLRYVKAQVDCFSLPTSAILLRCDMSLLRDCGYTGERRPDNFEELIQDCSLWDPESKELLVGFCKEFGKNYREEQLRGCTYYIERLDERREFLASHLPGKKKLNSTLCISGALAVVILLI